MENKFSFPQRTPGAENEFSAIVVNDNDDTFSTVLIGQAAKEK